MKKNLVFQTGMLHPGSWSKWRHLSREALIQVILDQQRIDHGVTGRDRTVEEKRRPGAVFEGQSKEEPEAGWAQARSGDISKPQGAGAEFAG